MAPAWEQNLPAVLTGDRLIENNVEYSQAMYSSRPPSWKSGLEQSFSPLESGGASRHCARGSGTGHTVEPQPCEHIPVARGQQPRIPRLRGGFVRSASR